jgi:hypothetical protein
MLTKVPAGGSALFCASATHGILPRVARKRGGGFSASLRPCHCDPRSSRMAGAKQARIPANISLLPLPPRAPELNSQENIWQFMRQNWLSNRIIGSSNPSTTSWTTPFGSCACREHFRPSDRSLWRRPRSTRTTARRSVSGRPRQSWVMWQNSRCSILFHFDVPG